MSELPRRPNDHLVEPMFAALGHHSKRGSPESPNAPDSLGAPEQLEPARAPRTARVLLWFALALAGGATIWILVAG